MIRARGVFGGVLVGILVSWLGAQAFAQGFVERSHGPDDNWGFRGSEELEQRLKKDLEGTRYYLDAWGATKAGDFTGPPWRGPVAQACKREYARLYQNPVTRFTVVLGYSDFALGSDPDQRVVEDWSTRQALTESLLTPCRGGSLVACGFKRDRDIQKGATILRKTIVGPDGEPRAVVIRLINSMTWGLERQGVRSRQAQELFYGGLRGDADVVIYSGHGGFNEKTRKNSLKFVRKLSDEDRERGINQAVLEALGQAGSRRPKVLALWGCNTWTLKDSILQQVKDLGVIYTNGVLYNDESSRLTLTTLNALLGMWCRKDLTRVIALDPDTGDELRAKPRLQGAFLRP